MSFNVCQSSAPPTCSVVSSQAGNARPERNTAEMAASFTERERRYSARIRTFSVFLVVPPIASAAVASKCMVVLSLFDATAIVQERKTADEGIEQFTHGRLPVRLMPCGAPHHSRRNACI